MRTVLCLIRASLSRKDLFNNITCGITSMTRLEILIVLKRDLLVRFICVIATDNDIL